jgi:hypothetical protein
MNKQILLQSIKSVAGYLALVSISLIALMWILSHLTEEIGVALIILSAFIGLVWFDYKNRMDKHNIEVMTRLKNGIK